MLSTQGTQNTGGGTKVMIKMKNLLNGNEWTWDRAKFTDRRFQMQELYQRYLEEEDPALLGPPATKVSFAKDLFDSGFSLLDEYQLHGLT